MSPKLTSNIHLVRVLVAHVDQSYPTCSMYGWLFMVNVGNTWSIWVWVIWIQIACRANNGNIYTIFRGIFLAYNYMLNWYHFLFVGLMTHANLHTNELKDGPAIFIWVFRKASTDPWHTEGMNSVHPSQVIWSPNVFDIFLRVQMPSQQVFGCLAVGYLLLLFTNSIEKDWQL